MKKTKKLSKKNTIYLEEFGEYNLNGWDKEKDRLDLDKAI